HHLLADDGCEIHDTLRAACATHGADYYDRFKAWADEYFFIPHRGRARGVGGSRAPLAAVRELGGRAFGLLVQALRRASRLAVTMEVRGFGGVVDARDRTWARPLRFGRADALLLGAAVAAAAAAPAVSELLGTHRFIWQ
ncbi:MAG: coproporphyrinogen III oxidase, partial [Micrococcales bacterium]|nr:coproporphyrinogen III oxidase [Micrococcales bacterium]